MNKRHQHRIIENHRICIVLHYLRGGLIFTSFINDGELIPSWVILVADDLEHRHEILLAEVIDVIVEEVEVEIYDEEWSNSFG